MSCSKLSCGFASLMVCVPALAGSHSWQFSEVFSDPSGTVQFLEFRECCGAGSENFVNGLQVTTANGTFTFPANLVGSTANKRLLLGTSAFAALPGAPVPDYIIPANFIPLNGGTIRYNPPGNYDTWTYGPGVIPTDGVHSVQFTSFTPFTSNDTFNTSGVNNPGNYTGGSGTVDVPTISEWGALALALLTMTAGSLMIRHRA